MDVHQNARLTPKGREAMVRAVVEYSLTKVEAARQFKTTAKTVAKWVQRFRAGGVDALRDRSSVPHSSPSQTPLATRDASCADDTSVLRQNLCPRAEWRFPDLSNAAAHSGLIVSHLPWYSEALRRRIEAREQEIQNVGREAQ
jgi:transposase-like protein